ncbi:uncharacterized protein LOC119835475 [Zerene cesonia]|uniref:uncharacterized protein LOC119835475 n=1 Tax=Zerene cesonia TaxID=33412 RepID=UPI0018E5A837|nr:uncharacterized protein LOC119835475 [Zerene cesonia]
MESPPSFSTHSEAPPLSEDSGLLITSGSFSSDSASGWHHIASELQESDFDERSLSLCESTDASERICGDFFNTVKKGPGKVILTAIEPPPEFQDNPVPTSVECTTTFVGTKKKCLAVCVPPSVICTNDIINKPNSTSLNIPVTPGHVSPIYPRKLKPEGLYDRRQCLNHRFASPRLLHLSPCRATRPSSRNSLSSRLSSSHNSLITQFQADDSSFITQAISHDALSAKTSDITDMYNVPFDSDIYAVPIDMIGPGHGNIRGKGKRPQRTTKRRSKTNTINVTTNNTPIDRSYKPKETRHKDTKTKRHSLPGSSCKKKISAESDTDSLHLTLREMRKYLHTLYSSSSDSECRNTISKKNNTILASVSVHSRHGPKEAATAVFLKESNEPRTVETNNNHKKTNKNTADMNVKNKKHKENASKDSSIMEIDSAKKKGNQGSKVKMSPVRLLSMNLKQSFCNLFRWRRSSDGDSVEKIGRDSPPPAVRRALPPLPQSPHPSNSRRSANDDDTVMDFATSIQKVKDYGWYWGPISVEAAEKILSNEPDGSFIVRDSSDDHYIFTLTFKLNGLRHVRIEHDQGNFSFGGCTMFKAQTIVEFIENAVETSRSGRYLFFLNLRPVLGPVRVQLLYPVSRFKRVQSLQHMCRFVILKQVRRDLISSLPLPRRLLDYLNATHYYSELIADL